jgi:OOP family OmpA-OmpF porin
MKVLQLSLLSLLLSFSVGVLAQGTPVPATNDAETVETTDMTIDELNGDEKMDKKSKVSGEKSGTMLEVGIRPSYMFVSGDVPSEAGYGVGLHLRKSLDHLFSIRVDGLYGVSKGVNDIMTRQFENTWISGSGMVVMTLNNFRFNGDTRSTNFYVMAGAGGNLVEVERQFGSLETNDLRPWQDGRNETIEQDLSVHAVAGGGVTFRLSPKFNIGAEFQSYIPFGKRADRLDGYEDGGNFRDIQNVASLSLNFNLGNASTKNEPLYWTNAFSPVRDELDRVSGKIDAATTDSDGDGVVDAIDQEANTPAGVPVDTV